MVTSRLQRSVRVAAGCCFDGVVLASNADLRTHVSILNAVARSAREVNPLDDERRRRADCRWPLARLLLLGRVHAASPLSRLPLDVVTLLVRWVLLSESALCPNVLTGCPFSADSVHAATHWHPCRAGAACTDVSWQHALDCRCTRASTCLMLSSPASPLQLPVDVAVETLLRPIVQPWVFRWVDRTSDAPLWSSRFSRMMLLLVTDSNPGVTPLIFFLANSTVGTHVCPQRPSDHELSRIRSVIDDSSADASHRVSALLPVDVHLRTPPTGQSACWWTPCLTSVMPAAQTFVDRDSTIFPGSLLELKCGYI